VGCANGQAFLHGDFSSFKAQRPDQAGVGIVHVGFVVGGADNRLVKRPVGTGNGVDGIHEQVGGTPLKRAAFLVSPAEGVGPDLGTGNASSQVIGHGQAILIGDEALAVDQPDVHGILEGKFHGALETGETFFGGVEVGVSQVICQFIVFFVNIVRLPQGGEAVGGGGAVEELEVIRFVAGDGGCRPCTSVDVEQAIRRIAAHPDGGGFRGSLVLAIGCKTNALELVADIITNRNTGLVGVAADEQDEFDLFAAVHVLAVFNGDAFNTKHHFVHLGFGALGVVGIFSFQPADGGGNAGVVRHVGDEREELGECTTAVDFAVEVIAVDQPVHRLAGFGEVEGVDFASGLKDRSNRVEGQLVIQTVG